MRDSLSVSGPSISSDPEFFWKTSCDEHRTFTKSGQNYKTCTLFLLLKCLFRYLFGLVVKQASQLLFREFYPSWRWSSPADRCCLLQLLDELEGRQAGGGKVVDYHSCELFPERWFDAVFVLRTDTKHLFDRLKARYIIFIQYFNV